MLEIDTHELRRMRAANRAERWPARQDEANRVEPECWPVITPRFKISRNSRVFTIGSCFARNIEYHLAQLGLDVPVHRFFEEESAYFEIAGPDILTGTRRRRFSRSWRGRAKSSIAMMPFVWRISSHSCSNCATAMSSICSGNHRIASG
jgi:hypothetical protein